MLEIIVCMAALAIDQLVKYWSVTVLAGIGTMPVIDGFFYMHYAKNYGSDVSFLRGRSAIMNIVRILQLVLVLYLLIKQRKKLAAITRAGLALFLAGMIGNQLNYLFMDFVPDMLYFPTLGNIVFNFADVWVMISMVVLFIRLAFFEGKDFLDWLEKKFKKPQKAPENTVLHNDENNTENNGKNNDENNTENNGKNNE